MDGTLELVARARASGARCPSCGAWSTVVHGTYLRRPADLPSLGQGVRLALGVRRFACREPACRRRTFAERLPGLLAPHARRTHRLAAAQVATAAETSAEGAARVLGQLGMSASADTLLRLLRRVPLPSRPTPRVLGVDDWAIRKGQTYGTILVDLEAHRVVDLLPDRTGTTLARWLRRHPAVTRVTRDRSTEYTRAITAALPTAIQVADRWHLLLNVRQMLERWFAGIGGHLRALPVRAEHLATAGVRQAGARTAAFPRSPSERQAGAAARDRWRVHYDEVRRRHAAGEPLARIARVLGLALGTVRRFAAAPTFPERVGHPVRPSSLDPFLPYLTARHAQGIENAGQLWRELRARGYTGQARQIHRWLQPRRRVPAPTLPHAKRAAAAALLAEHRAASVRLPSPRHLAWLATRLPHEQSAEAQTMLAHIAQDEEVAHVLTLVSRFGTLIRERTQVANVARAFSVWLDDARRSGIRALTTFAAGLTQDRAAVTAALTTPWSNAQTEGHVTKLKLLKRQMYGRASFELLRRRVLLAA